MKRRAEAFEFPFEQWGDTKRPRQDAAAAIEAVDVLAGATDNVSRQLLSTAIAEIFESHDEAAVAKLLQQWVNGDDYHTSPLLNQDADEVMAREEEQSEGDNTGEDSQVREVFEHTNTVNSQNSTTDNQEFTEVEQQWTDVANYE
jgi:hypothetical protein